MSPVLFGIGGGLGAAGLDSVKGLIAGTAIVVVLLAAWNLARRAMLSGAGRSAEAIGGMSLAAVWASFAIFSAMGPPELATLGENLVRYPLLLIDSLLVCLAFAACRDALADSQGNVQSALGNAAIMMATPLYVVFTVAQLLLFRVTASGGSVEAAPWLRSLDEASLFLLYFGTVLTYGATAAFAAAMASAGWIRQRARNIYVTLSVAAILLVGVRIVDALAHHGSDVWSAKQALAFPGFVLTIPALPWIMPCLLGIAMLKRAASAPS